MWEERVCVCIWPECAVCVSVLYVNVGVMCMFW